MTMQEATATELAKHFGRYRELVQREPIAVTSHGRATAYLVSAAEYEELQRFKEIARRSFATVALPENEVEAIANGRMSAEHDALDALLDRP